MKLDWTDKMFWPAALAGWSGIFLAAGVALGIGPLLELVSSAKIGLAGLAAFLFFLVLIDANSRRAIVAYNLHARNLRDLTWIEGWLPPGIDRRLSSLGPVALIEVVVFNIRDERQLALLAVLSFFVTGLMSMLMVKRGVWPQVASSETFGQPKRKRGFLIDGGDGGD